MQRLVDIGNNILHILDADRKPDEIGGDAGGNLLLLAQLLVGRGSRMNDQRFGIADIGQMRKQLHVVDELLARLDSPLDAETDDCACPFRQIFLRPVIVWMARQARLVDPGDQRMLLQPFGNLLAFSTWRGIRTWRVSSPWRIWKAVERREAGAHVAQQRHPHLEDVGEVAQSLPVPEPVIGGVRLGEFGEFAVVPGECATIDDAPADAGAMAADELGEGIDDDIGAVLRAA